MKDQIEIRATPVQPRIEPSDEITSLEVESDVVRITFCPQNSVQARGSLKSYQTGFVDLGEL